MDPTDGHTLISVRGEAHSVVDPDRVRVFTGVTAVADSKNVAASTASSTLTTVLAALAGLGGQSLTVRSLRSPLTWSTQSIQTYEEHGTKRGRAEHGPTGRHRATASLHVGVRDFTLLDQVGAILTSDDSIDIRSVQWGVDDDNPAWALVRADAIRAALVKGQDYAAALGGSVVRVEAVADAGLLGERGPGQWRAQAESATMDWSEQPDSISLDPVPQTLSATIDARLSATVGPLPTR